MRPMKPDDVRDAILEVTGERWPAGRVEALLAHLAPPEALKAVERAHRIRKALDRRRSSPALS